MKNFKDDANDAEEMLFVAASDKYGDKYIEHLLDQYKIYINAAEKISDRRQKTNEFFLGLNTALVAILGFIATRTGSYEIGVLLAVSAVAGTAVCYLWYRIIYSYKGLNGAKFKVIHLIEMRLPLALYDTEWELLGRGDKKSLYWPVTHIEEMVPWVFISIYGALLIFTLPIELLLNSCVIYAWF